MKKFIFILLFIPTLCFSQTVQSMRDSLIKYEVYEVEVSLAIIIFETGLKSNGMLLKRNNLFAFNSKNGYIRFKSYKSAILSYKHYQEKKYLPYKKLHPNKSYYDYLLQSNYVDKKDIVNYVKQLKIIVKQLK